VFFVHFVVSPWRHSHALDGRLRRDFDANTEVDVEVLDVTDDEARALLLSIDPVAQLAALAQTQQQLHDRLLELAPPVADELRAAWQGSAAAAEAIAGTTAPEACAGPEQWLILISCRDEKHQTEMLRRLHGEGVECKALLS
jgi:hypothetical protein